MTVADQRRRLLWYLTVVLGLLIAYALAYQWGMQTFEGESRSFVSSLQIVVESFTTTGYGEDASHWSSAPMELLAIAMQLTGVLTIFAALPLFVGPWMERRLRSTPPTAVEGLEGHVVLCEFTPRGEALLEELSSWGRGHVIIEPDRNQAVDLREAGWTAIHGDPESVEVLRGAGVPAAATVVADGTDAQNAGIALSIREIAEAPQVIALAEDPDVVDHLRYAGADEVLSPRELVGEALAHQITAAISPELHDAVRIGEEFEIVELPIQPGCDLDGVRLGQSGIRERTGVNVIGLWRSGEFESAPGPAATLDKHTILLVSGSENQLADLKQLTLTEARRRRHGTVLIAGHGKVGATVRDEVSAGGMDARVIDLESGPAVDVVGDVTREETLEAAGIDDANSLVLALSDDTAIMLATLVARERRPDLRIVVRAHETESVGKLYRAGADYVVALATVSGRMIASRILDEEVVAPTTQIELVRTAAPALAGQSLGGADVRSRTGATVIAVERGDHVVTDLGPGFTIRPDDMLVVAGTDTSINRFNALAQ